MWKRLLLINTNIWSNLITDNFNLPPLGLEYLVSYVRDLIKVEILDARNFRMSYQKIENYIKSYKPDIVGINCNFTCGINAAFETARLVKEKYNPECPVIFGGWHPTLKPDECLKNPWVDAIILGEGELTLRELIKKGSFENVDGIFYKKEGKIVHNKERQLIENLDDLKFPYRENRKFKKFQMFNIPVDTIETSRGCPHTCKFCCIHVFYRHRWRPRSPLNIIKELYEIRKNSNVRDILIVDDNFTVNMKRIEKLCKLIIKSKLDFHFICQTRLDSIAKNPKIVRLMAKAGFWLMFVGIESITKKGLTDVNKKINVETIHKAIKILHENHIIIVGNVIIGADLDETEEDIMKNVDNIKKLQVDFMSYSILTPLPSTKIFEKLENENLIINKNWADYNFKNAVIKTHQLTPKDLTRITRLVNINAALHRSNLNLFRKLSKSRGILFIIKNGINSALDIINIFLKAKLAKRQTK
ncbi:MAG: B12-binding domain-containing radical SAM protein [Candidatus Helarchaeota archaeon]